MKASKKAQEFSMWASEKQREECPMSDLWISVKCGESDTTSGLAANPTVGNLMDKLEPLGVHLCFGETSELTGAEKVCATRGATKEASDKFMKTWSAYNDFILKEATDDLSESQPTPGNIVGNPIEPVVKLTANPLTVKGMGEHIDCDVSKILSREMNMSEAGDKLIEATLRVANGRLTCAEALGHKEFVMTKLYRSA